MHNCDFSGYTKASRETTELLQAIKMDTDGGVDPLTIWIFVQMFRDRDHDYGGEESHWGPTHVVV